MALTAEQVVRIVGRGRLEDHQIAEIIASGASEEELLEAFDRTNRGGDVGAEVQRPSNPRVEQLCEILTLDEPDWEE